MNNKYLLLASMALFGGNALAQQKPNVLIIYADDLGYGDLECYGNRLTPTPNANSLAAEGCIFTNAHAVASTSTPSRYSLLTGEYAWRRPGTDIARGDAGMIIRPEMYTLADLFKNAGYHTGAFGKWHLGLGDKTGTQDWNAPLAAGLSDLGFEYSYIMAATGDRTPCVFLENGRVQNLDLNDPIEVSYTTPFEGLPTGKQNPELCFNLQSDHGHDNAIINGIGRIGYMKGGTAALWKDENIADSIAVHAADFILEHKDEPFFMYVATNDIHVPRFPHERFRGKSPMGLRGDAIAQFDWTVGQLLSALKQAGVADNTIIILSSDNGPVINDGYKDRAEELLGDHKAAGPFRGNKYSAFEGGTRVPFIVCAPGLVQKGSRSDALISQIDFLASFAALLGERLPEDAAPDSQNCIKSFLGEDKQGRDWVIEQALDHTLSIVTKEWKYIEPSDNPYPFMHSVKVETGYAPEPQLYKIGSDIFEENNLAGKHPDIVYKFQTQLRQIRKQAAY